MSLQPCIVSVEDDPGVFKLIEKILRSLPVELHHAKNGYEALSLVSELQPDLILLDISLPDIHGWDVLRQVRALPLEQQPEVLVLTAQTGPAHRVIGHLQQVALYVSKPFLPSELREGVCEILGVSMEV